MDPNNIDMDRSPKSDNYDQALALRAPVVGLTGNAVKMIAIVSMLIDHIGYAIVWPYLMHPGFSNGMPGYRVLFTIYIIMRAIGRLAFPIFCFFVTEGLLHTRSRAAYAGRLAVFAVISEVPFNLAFYQSFKAPEHNNVFITLLIGLLMIWCLQEIKERFEDRGVVLKGLLYAAVISAACAAAWKIKCDYEGPGILCIATFWVLRNTREWAATIGVGWLVFFSSFMEISALVDIPILMHYNGKRGAKNFKYFFYLFYPVHLIILAFIANKTGIVTWR